MKRVMTLTILTFLAGSLFSMNATAGYKFGKFKQCRTTPATDVRGAAEFDLDGDGNVTIAEVVVANPFENLGTLLFAVENADPAVLEALSNPNADLTVFAPDDDAFAAIPPMVLDGIIADSLTEVLLYHVVPGQFDPRRVFYVRSVESLLTQDLFVKRGRKNPTINNSEIACGGVRTDNGLVWLIDSVLMPQY